MKTYKDIIIEARKKGVASEKAMWDSIEDVNEIVNIMKEYHPEEYWKFMRKTHENLYGYHFNEEFANYEVSLMYHTNDNGEKVKGSHWTKEEVLAAWQGKSFSSETTDYDKFVAANAIWHDMRNKFADSDVLEMAYLFFFCDEDAPEGKVWLYFKAM